MTNLTHIYAGDAVARWNVQQTQSQEIKIYDNVDEFLAVDSTKKSAVFFIAYPFDSHKELRDKINQVIHDCHSVAILMSELHDTTMRFFHQQQHPKITYFLCGYSNKIPTRQWMDFFSGTSYFYKVNAISPLVRLAPYNPKPKSFDILLGQPKAHRTIIYDYIVNNNLQDQVVMTYLERLGKIIPGENTAGWIWEDDGVEVIDQDLRWTVSQVKYFGHKMSLSQVVPINIYNETAFSVIAETNFDNEYSFYTEKTVKPILGRRLFLAFSGQYFLRNLRSLGFKTFDGIIDESYDLEPDLNKRGQMICEQISYLLNQTQRLIFEQIKPITEYNYQHMMTTDWVDVFSKELLTVLLDQQEQN